MPPLSRYRWPHLPLLWVDGLSASLPPWVGGLWAAPEVQAAPVPPLSRYRWPHFLSCGWMAPVPPFGRSGPTLPPPNSWPSGFLWGDCPQPSCGQTHLSQPSPRSPVRPLFPPLPPPFASCPDTTPRFPLLWMDGSMPHFRPLRPTLPPFPPPPHVSRPVKAPPLGGQADDRAPLPNKAARPHRTPALFNSSHLRGRALPSTPPPLHPRFWHWTPSSLARCCLLSSPARGRPPPGEESPRSNPPTDRQGARFSPYLSATTPPEGFSDYTVVTDRDCAGK